MMLKYINGYGFKGVAIINHLSYVILQIELIEIERAKAKV